MPPDLALACGPLPTTEGALIRTKDKLQDILAFLSGGEGSGYVPQSGEITGILKELGAC